MVGEFSERVLDAVMDPRLIHGFPLAMYRRLRYRPGWSEGSRPKKVYVCVTFDVEGNFRDVLNPQASIDFMPRFIEWSKTINLRATLYVQGSVVADIYGYLRDVTDTHQLGLHGFVHEVWGRARWWQTSLKIGALARIERRRILQQALEQFERYGLQRPTSFRAPYLNIDDYTLGILRECGFRSDSSASSFLGHLSLPKEERGVWEIPVSAHPRTQLGQSPFLPFRFQDFSLGSIWAMQKQTFMEAVDSVVALQHRSNSPLPAHIVILGHPWEFDDDGGVAHASIENFGVIEQRIDWIASKYDVELSTLDQLIASRSPSTS